MKFLIDDLKAQFQRPNNALVQIIVINVVVFVVANLMHFFSDDLYELVDGIISLPKEFSEFIFKPWTLVTYAFTQYGLWHIFMNMLVLYYFGMLIHDFLGSNRLVSLYILGAVAGGVAFLIPYNTIEMYMATNSSGLIGASGAVFAVAVAAATIAPDYQFHLVFIGPVRIKYIVAVLFFISLIGTKGSNAGGNFAHLGGAAMGYIYIRQLQQGNDWGKPIISTLDFFKKLFSPSSRIKVTHRGFDKKKSSKSTTKTNESGVNQHEIDRILDKISQSGYESLTKEEKQKLFSASQKNN